jgi:hypothetical protein
MESEMKTTEMKPTTRLRWLPLNDKKDELRLQQWWSNADSVKMGPVHMVVGEWRDVPVDDLDEMGR